MLSNPLKYTPNNPETSILQHIQHQDLQWFSYCHPRAAQVAPQTGAFSSNKGELGPESCNRTTFSRGKVQWHIPSLKLTVRTCQEAFPKGNYIFQPFDSGATLVSGSEFGRCMKPWEIPICPIPLRFVVRSRSSSNDELSRIKSPQTQAMNIPGRSVV